MEKVVEESNTYTICWAGDGPRGLLQARDQTRLNSSQRLADGVRAKTGWHGVAHPPPPPPPPHLCTTHTAQLGSAHLTSHCNGHRVAGSYSVRDRDPMGPVQG